MTQCENDILFELLRASLWQRKADIALYAREGEWKWKNILTSLDDNALIGVVADVIFSLPEEYRPGMNVQTNLMQYVAVSSQLKSKINDTTALIFDAMQKRGLHPVLLKGQVLESYYPARCHRALGDIDVFLPLNEYEEACNVVNALCGCKDKSEGLFEDRVHYHVTSPNGIEIEVHRKAGETPDPAQFDDYNAWADEMLKPECCRRMTINGVEILIPSDRFTLVFNYQHLAKHFASKGIGLRQFVDWALLMHAYSHESQEFWELIDADVKQHIRKKAWQILQGILVYQLGLPVEECRYWNASRARKSQGELLQYIIDSGNFGEKMSWSDIIKDMERGTARTLTGLKYLLSHTRMLSKVSWHWAYHYITYVTRTALENKTKGGDHQ